ncbi:hypothetical protein AABM36_08385 [Kocuria sp. KSNUG]|uniref:hypothetical protein n=1 Tax=Kocuria sp. KSNUG TaxID=3136676 RepID=UPI001EC17F63|nr:hypothetical protein [Kocuria rhizophila]
MSALCVVDGAPATMGNLCTQCVTALHTAVLEVPRLLRELDVTITKQSRQGTFVAGASGERPLVLNLSASAVADSITVALRTVAHLGAQEHEPIPVAAAALSPWTARRLKFAVRRPEIEGAHDALLEAVREGWRSVDRAPERRVVGTCDCGGVLATAQLEGEVRCPACGVLWDVEEREEARNQMLLGLTVCTADLVTLFRTVLGKRITTDTVRKWVQRRQLRPVRVDPMMFRATDAVQTWERLHGLQTDERQGRAKEPA